ncbi:hypothetical protein PIB30_098366, partial [Stylosanthes scabra]|nr:hypothetical protein [Stylosanthes scabra]
FQSQEDEDEFHKQSTCNGLEDRNAAVVVQRPPPKPLDLKSSMEELFTMQMPACKNVIEVAENEYGIHSGAVLEKGNVNSTKVEPAEVENGVDDDDGTESSADAKEKRRTIVAGVDATMTDGGLQARRLRQFVSDTAAFPCGYSVESRRQCRRTEPKSRRHGCGW